MESGVEGKYLTGEEQCALAESFGSGALHSTHSVHLESPSRDVFRLSNDPSRGFNSVVCDASSRPHEHTAIKQHALQLACCGMLCSACIFTKGWLQGPEWHNDGSFVRYCTRGCVVVVSQCSLSRNVFGHVVYHIVKAPVGPGDTQFAHLGTAYDMLSAGQQQHYSRCASANSNGGVMHPLVHLHPLSGRPSLYLHTGMTGNMLTIHSTKQSLSAGAVVEREHPKPEDGKRLDGLRAWNGVEMNRLFLSFTELLDRYELRGCTRHHL